jgi:hypothetical protein
VHDGPEEHQDTAETPGRTYDDLEAPEDPLNTAITPTTSRRQGGFNFDQEWGLYPLQWDNMDDLEAWHWKEELAYTIKILASSQYYGGPTLLWTLCHIVKLPRGLSVQLERFQVMAIVWERRKMLPAELR